MSQQRKPYQQFEFKGLNLTGNPLNRPFGTASVCQDLRIMPGDWIRLKGGRKARYNLTNGVYASHFINANIRSSYGNDYALMLATYGGSTKLLRINLSNWTIDETGLETIHTGWDSSLPVAHAVLSDSVIWDNGRGGIDSYIPISSLTQWQPPSTIRYFGLDFTVIGIPPSISFSSGGSGYNSVTTAVKIYYGLHNTVTGHYSNGVLVGTVNATSGTGVITVEPLDDVVTATHSGTESAELKLVFYATIDGFNVPYLIMNSTLDGPFTASLGTVSVDLDLVAGTVNGWVLDTTKEMPVSNYAPRRMRSVCYANGRLYGILSPTATTQTGNYQITAAELSQVVWSDAEGSVKSRDYLGDPLQSWPSFNASNTPSGERPLVVFPAPNMVEVLVFTSTHTFILREQADGVHDWDTISNEHGLEPSSWYKLVCRTRHGIVWVTQNKQLAIYTNEGEFKILSGEYDAGVRSLNLIYACINYIYDPINLLDQVQVFKGNLGSFVHDFNTGAFSTTEPHIISAAGVISRQNQGTEEKHVVIAAANASNNGCGVYSMYGQADEGGLERTYDELFTSASGQTKATQELPAGLYSCNWSVFEDANLRKEITQVDVIGDAKAYAQTAGGSIVLNWRAALEYASGGTAVLPTKVTNEIATEPGDLYYRFKISQPGHWAWMFSLILYSHSNERVQFPLPGLELLNNSNNLYGAVVAMLLHFGKSENRL